VKITFEGVDDSSAYPPDEWLQETPAGDLRGFPPAPGRYNVKITADDGRGGTDSKIIEICVDAAPVFHDNERFTIGEGKSKLDLSDSVDDADVPGQSDRTVAAEVSLEVAAATTPDFDNQVLTFALVGGPDKGDFKLDPNGILKFKKKPDFEKPKDSNHDNTYKVKIEVTDGFFSDEAMLKIKVKDKPEGKAMAASLAELDQADAAVHHVANWLLEA
jgi:hypothetical protein